MEGQLAEALRVVALAIGATIFLIAGLTLTFRPRDVQRVALSLPQAKWSLAKILNPVMALTDPRKAASGETFILGLRIIGIFSLLAGAVVVYFVGVQVIR